MKFKKKLISATLSLVVATVLMASSSYAWFTISTNPEISKIKTSITANENIEIALDNGYENAEAIDAASAVVSGTGTAGNPYTWGNLLDMTTAMTNIGANLSLKPVGYSTKTEGSETKVVMKTPQYGLDGRVAKLVDMAQEYISAYDGVTTPSGGISIFKQTEDTDEADALALSFWLRANADVSLMLSEGTYRADDGENTAGTVNAESGGGSRLSVTFPGVADAVRTFYGLFDSTYKPLLSEALLNYMVFYFFTPGKNEDLSTYVNQWNEALDNVMQAFSESMEGYPFDLVIKTNITDGNFNCHQFSLDEIQEVIVTKDPADLYPTWDGEGFAYGEYLTIGSQSISNYQFRYLGAVDFILSIEPSPQLLRLLNKLKIRFVVSSEDGTQELYAKIIPEYDWSCAENYYNEALPEAYEYQPVYEGVTFSSDYSLSAIHFDSTKRTPQLFGNSLDLKLSFFNEEDDGFDDYLASFEMERRLEFIRAQNLISGPACNIAAEIEQAEIGVGFYDVYNDIVDAIESHLDRTFAAEKKACLMQLPHIDLTANEAKKVDVYMYLDGELITNADAITMDGVEIALNLQFEKIGGAENAMTGRVYEEEESSSESE